MGKMHLAPAGPASVALHLTDRHRFRNHVTFKVGLEGFTWQIDEGHLEHPIHHLGDILTCNTAPSPPLTDWGHLDRDSNLQVGRRCASEPQNRNCPEGEKCSMRLLEEQWRPIAPITANRAQ